MKVAALSVSVVDTYPQKEVSCLGGNSLNFAVQCIRQGVKNVSLISAVGSDANGVRIVDTLKNEGVNCSHVHFLEGNTATNKLYLKEDGERYAKPEDWDGGVYENYFLNDSDWTFLATHDLIGTHANNPNFLDVVGRKQESQLLSVDFLHLQDYNLLESVVKKVDIAFFGGDISMQHDLKIISKKHQALIVLTLGALGSIAFFKGDEIKQLAVPVNKVVDTTGCGDAFQAVFAINYFQKKTIKKCMQLAAIASSEVLKRLGGIGC